MSPLCIAQTQSHFVQAVSGSQCLVPDVAIGEVEEHVNDILSPPPAANQDVIEVVKINRLEFLHV